MLKQRMKMIYYGTCVLHSDEDSVNESALVEKDSVGTVQYNMDSNKLSTTEESRGKRWKPSWEYWYYSILAVGIGKETEVVKQSSVE
eukprot:IDg16903t1